MKRFPHLRFSQDKINTETKDFKYNYGGRDGKKDKQKTDLDYKLMAVSFQRDLESFDRDREFKYRVKDRSLNVPYDIDYIEIHFQDIFNIDGTWRKYYNDFGLQAVSFYEFGRKGLFEISDSDKFKKFLGQISNFVDQYTEPDALEVDYDHAIKYIRRFNLWRTLDILKFNVHDAGNIVQLSLINSPLPASQYKKILDSLFSFLSDHDVSYLHDEESHRIELQNIPSEKIMKIIENFDIIESATCSAYTIVRPGRFHSVLREYGFSIDNMDEDLPVIGIIDTGISMETAIAPLVIRNSSFSLTGNSSFIDDIGSHREGHGTAVAGLAALGRFWHSGQVEREVHADARLLSIKILDDRSTYISEMELMRMLYRVKDEYPEIRIFTLTVGYINHLNTNEPFSNYTYLLDKFAWETDSLIFISTGNNKDCINKTSHYELSYFLNDYTNLCTPADSMNNMVVGAAAGNLNPGEVKRFTHHKNFPALFTRKGHIDLRVFYSENERSKTNKNYFKPDVIEYGGDIGLYDGKPDYTDESALTVLSARPEQGLCKVTGTSFSAPLTANLAAKIIKRYPSLSNESVKALIINGALRPEDLNKFDISEDLERRIVGHGLIDVDRSLFSNENMATIILEDEIAHGKIKVYPIRFPEYLVGDQLADVQKRVTITATLCFKFKPIKNNQLSYNPVHMAFSIFRNHDASEIMKTNEESDSKIIQRVNWSQNGRDVSKPLPYSNVQKFSFTAVRKHLLDEENTFSLAIHAKVSKQIVGGLPSDYPKTFPFSLVITIEEAFKNNTGKLYEEIIAINELESLTEIDVDTDLDISGLEI